MSDAPPESAPLDNSQLLVEIRQEVERRRASGDLPAEMERELDRTFAEFAPVDALDANFDTIVSKIERSAVIDLSPSVVSAYPGAAQMKQVVAKATAFYVRHVATQASSLFQGVARALRLLGERVDELELSKGAGDPARWRELEGLPEARWSPSSAVSWDDYVLEQLGAPSGRVLHTHAGDGHLVRRLIDAGYEAYGVEPVADVALAASDVVPDVRAMAAADHLRILPPGSLTGLVLSGLVEVVTPASLVELVGLAASSLAKGGTVVVLSAHPDAWRRAGPPLAVDLAPGRPVHPETWETLLARAGFVDVTTRLGFREQLAEVAGSDAACNDNFARLAAAVFGPADFAVRARRPL